jgi:hemoglobin
MSETLFDRLGGADGIARIVSAAIDNHLKNPVVANRFSGSDVPAVKKTATDFFITGSGGPNVYRGKDMLTAHRHMNISDSEFMAVVDDVMAALSAAGLGDGVKSEVLYIFYSLRPQVVGV